MPLNVFKNLRERERERERETLIEKNLPNKKFNNVIRYRREPDPPFFGFPFFLTLLFLFSNTAFAFSNPTMNPTGGTGSIYIEASTPANTLYLKSNGNVGIGTITPGTLLDVRGGRISVGTNTFSKSVGQIGDIVMDNGTTDTPGIHFYNAANQNFGIDVSVGLRFVENLDESGGVVRMFIQPGGNVGIGKTNPVTALDVNGTVTATAFAGPLSGSISSANVSSGSFGANTGGGNYSFPASVGIQTATPGVRLDIPTTGSTPNFRSGSVTMSSVVGTDMVLRNLNQLRFSDADVWDWNNWAGIKYQASTNKIIIGGPASSYFNSNASPPNVQVVFDGVSGVGVGTASPAAKLDVNGTAYIPQMFINRSSGAGRGISWYSPTYTSWTDYMCQAGQTGCGPNGNLTTPSGTLVTSWGQRSFIENLAGYGWTFESGTSTGQPAVVAEIRSSDGSAKFNGTVTANAFTGPLTGTTSAANVSSGSFGTNTGGGNYSFPANVGIRTTPDVNTELKIDSDRGSAGQAAQSNIYAGGTTILGEFATLAHRNSAWSTIYASSGSSTSYSGYFDGKPLVVMNANVGIGTTTPAAKLDVVGGINMTGVLDAGSAAASGYRFNGRSISWNSSMQDPVSYVPHVFQQTYSGWDPVIGVKTTNGFWQMGAYSSDTLHLGYMAGAFGSHATNAFDNSIAITPSNVAIGNVGTMGLTVSGNVGIGNTAPTQKLDVTGAVKATNFLGGPLSSLGDYVWSSATTAQNLPNGISSSFVQAPNGFPSYGTVINARTYSGGGGGGLQIYAPYGNGYGGTSLQYRLADYSVNAADPPWTPWKTIADSDNGYQGAAFVPSGAGMVMIGPNAVTRYGGGAWDGQVYSKEGFTGGAYVSVVVKSLSNSYMFGLNTDPTTDASYCSLDFAWYITASSNGYIYESCGNPASGITISVGDVLAISYDGANIKYIQNGIVRRTVAAYITSPLYFDSSFVNGLSTGPTISNIQFNALTGSSCTLVSYTGGTTSCPTGYYTWSGTALASGYMLCCRVSNPI